MTRDKIVTALRCCVSICPGSSTMPDEDYKKLITVVEHWSKEYPRKAMKFRGLN